MTRLLGLLLAFQLVAAGIMAGLWLGFARTTRANHAAMVALVEANTFQDALHTAESGLRGYALTGDARYLGVFQRGREASTQSLDRLHALTKAVPALSSSIQALDRVAQAKHAWMDRTLSLEQQGAREEVITRFREAGGLALMEDVGHVVRQLEADEQANVRALDARAKRNLAWGLGLLALTTLAAVALLLLDIQDRRWVELRLRQSSQLLMELSEGTAQSVGADYFEALAVHAAKALGTRWAAIVQFDSTGSARTLALVEHGRMQEGVQSFASPRCPCADPASDGVCYAPDHAVDRHPDHPLVQRLGVKSFLGVAMKAGERSKGAVLVMDDQPMTDTDLAVPALKAFAERSAAELARLETEQALRQAQKMDALGALAGGIVHDSNNILNAILAASDLVELRLPSEHPARSALEVIRSAVNRGSELNQQVLSFARKSESQTLRLNLEDVVREVSDLLSVIVSKGIQIRTVVEGAKWVEGDPGRLHQVVLNLALNGCHAMGEGPGTLTLSLAEVVLDGAAPDARMPEVPSGRYARLTVEDTGCGISPAALERIFDPFFTTKPEGRGTGLGLFVVQGIVRQHHGVIRARSDLGKGTVFEVLLPAIPAPSDLPRRTSLETLRGAERILLIEPDELRLALLKQGLHELGYEIAACANASEALTTFMFSSKAFDVVVTAQTPGDPGPASLLHRLRNLQPTLPGILMADPMRMVNGPFGAHAEFDKVLLCPLSSKDLARAIRSCQDAPLRTSATSPENPQPTVLVADDSPLDRRFIASTLTHAGYRVQEACDGQEVLEALLAKGQAGAPSMMILDLSMPKLGGESVIQAMHERGLTLPTIVATSLDDKATLRRVLDLGVDDFLIKPFTPALLVRGVDRLLTNPQSGSMGREDAS